MKGIKHELLADEIDYIYLKYSGKKYLDEVYVDKNRLERCDEINKEDNINKGLSSFHKASEFWFVIKGSYTVYVNGEEVNVKAGDILFIDSYKVHYFKGGYASAKIDLVVDNKFLTSIIGNVKSFPMLIKNSKLFNELIALVNDTFNEWEVLSKEQKIGFVYRVLGLIVQRIGVDDFRTDRKSDEFAKKIIAYLYANYDTELNIKTLAKEFGYTESYFSELFNKVVGMNLREYVNRLRISIAEKMKEENPDMSFREISERVGYNSWVTFYRAYSKFSKLKEKN